jgi:hypothetical protein
VTTRLRIMVLFFHSIEDTLHNPSGSYFWCRQSQTKRSSDCRSTCPDIPLILSQDVRPKLGPDSEAVSYLELRDCQKAQSRCRILVCHSPLLRVLIQSWADNLHRLPKDRCDCQNAVHRASTEKMSIRSDPLAAHIAKGVEHLVKPLLLDDFRNQNFLPELWPVGIQHSR